jgi:hypothetical protein
LERPNKRPYAMGGGAPNERRDLCGSL